jgi:FkbM family methyltransferase
MRAIGTFNRLRQCRHGMMLYNFHDLYIGRSLETYGEFSQGETDLFAQLVRPGQTVLDVGANIGAHTVFFAQAVGPSGSVFAFEPQRIVYQTLCGNLALNSLTNTHCFHAAVGSTPGRILLPVPNYGRPNNFGGFTVEGHRQGESVPLLTIDSLKLPRCDFIKIDVEGMEQAVLAGAVETIAKFKPVLYVENDREAKSAALIRFIDELGYHMYWHRPLLFNPNNFAGCRENIFGPIISLNMLCCAKMMPQDIRGLDRVETAPHQERSAEASS